MPDPSDLSASKWPPLPYEAWKDTCATLHMWTQIVGKIRRVLAPPVNHCWHVALYLTAHGLTTSPMSYGKRHFEIEFDLVDHRLLVRSADAGTRTMRLEPRSVADFYGELLAELAAIGVKVDIHAAPNEVADAIPFAKDTVHAAYDAEYANRFWRALAQADRVFKQFRGDFIGKCSPVHFFWGSFDLAVTRFSGRRAPEFTAAVPNCPTWVMRDAYSHEVASCGFWPGNAAMPDAAYYAYAYPEPAGYGDAIVRPQAARYDAALREFILPYDEVRQASDPDRMLLDFLQDTYEAAATLAGWDREALERTFAAGHTA